MTKPRKYHIDDLGREYREEGDTRYTYLHGKMPKIAKSLLRRHLENPDDVVLPVEDWDVWSDDVSEDVEPEPSLPQAPPPQKPRPRLRLRKPRITFVPRV